MRILFMGTPDFAATILEKIILDGHEVIGAVTQPDKEKGRRHEICCSEVKKLAIKYEIPVFQPVKARDEEFLKKVIELDPEIIIVAAFGQILPKTMLDIPKFGCINVHASLLPKYRGAAPIQYSIIDGEKETGVTIMHMDVGIDTGDMILQEAIPIAKEETGGSLFDKLAILGGDLLLKALKQIQDQTAVRTEQDNEKANYVKIINKDMGKIDFNQPAVNLERLIRGLNPWPSAYTSLDGKTLKLWKADVVKFDAAGELGNINAVPGEVIKTGKDSIYVMTGEDILIIKELQLEGKKRMSSDAFLRGYPIQAGTILGCN
jgi:methionyl-tRNA formyltransferase